jgi:hypothetical protein
MLRNIHALFSWICIRCVSKSAVGSSLDVITHTTAYINKSSVHPLSQNVLPAFAYIFLKDYSINEFRMLKSVDEGNIKSLASTVIGAGLSNKLSNSLNLAGDATKISVAQQLQTNPCQ